VGENLTHAAEDDLTIRKIIAHGVVLIKKQATSPDCFRVFEELHQSQTKKQNERCSQMKDVA
jgi:hypothetical protein